MTNWGRRLAGKVAALGGDFSGSRVLASVQWSATDNSNYTISGTGNTFTHADNGAPLLPNPNGVSGGFKGDLVLGSGSPMDHGDFQFNVDLNTGFVSGASMQGFDSGDIRLFGAYQGTGRLVPVSSTSDILVDTWTTSTGGHFVLRSPVFDTSTRANQQLTGIAWSARDTGGSNWSGTGSNFEYSASGYPAISTNSKGIQGGYKGDLNSVGAGLEGKFQFNVALDTGAISGASMTLTKTGGNLVMGVYGGRGGINGPSFIVKNWNKTLGDSAKLSVAELSGDFDDDKTLSGLSWRLTDDTFGAGLRNLEQLPAGYTPLERPPVSGHFSGAVRDSGNYDIGTFDFDLDLATSRISNAALSGTDGSNIFSAVAGSGSFTGQIFTINNFLGDTDTVFSGILTADASNSEQTVTGITWKTQIGSSPVTLNGSINTFDPVMANKGPEHIQGTFTGTQVLGAGETANIGFTVGLGTGWITNASLNIVDATSNPLFSGTGGTIAGDPGTGSISFTNFGFTVTGIVDPGKTGWQGDFAGQFTSANGGMINQWNVKDGSSTTQHSGAGMSFGR